LTDAFTCVARIHDREHAIRREVGTQASFYQPVIVDGVCIFAGPGGGHGGEGLASRSADAEAASSNKADLDPWGFFSQTGR